MELISRSTTGSGPEYGRVLSRVSPVIGSLHLPVGERGHDGKSNRDSIINIGGNGSVKD